MKKLLFLTLTVALLLCLVACNGQTEHTHKFGEWSTTKNATCTEDGVKTRYCDCGEKQSDAIPANGHKEQILPAKDATCTETGITEGKKCSTCGKILVEQEIVNKKSHTEEIIPSVEPTCTETGLTEGKKCTVCKNNTVEQETIAALDHNMRTYSEKDENCNVYNVTVCDREGCDYIDRSDTGVVNHNWKDATCTEPKTCQHTGCGATEGEANGHNFGKWITVKDSTETEEGLKERTCTCGEKETKSTPTCSIGLQYKLNYYGTGYILAGPGTCTDTDIIIPKTYCGLPVSSIENYAFYNNDITSVVIPDSVTSIGDYAFKACPYLTSVVIGAGVTTIGKQAFYYCDNLTSIVIGFRVASIGDMAFAWSDRLRDVYYTGSEERWNGITIGTSNIPLKCATIHYNYVPEN